MSHEDAAEAQRWALSESIAPRFPATRVGSAVVAALTRTRRGLVSELPFTTEDDDVPTDCVVNFDNLHTLPRATFHNATTGRDCHDIVAGVRTGRH